MMSRQWIFTFFLVLLSFQLVSATVFLNIYGNGTVQPGQNITVTGTFSNDTSTSGPRPFVNITSFGNFSSGMNASTSSSNATFYLNITSPSTTGDFVFNISTNSSDLCGGFAI